MGLAEQRTALRATILTVANVGPVIEYEPALRTKADFDAQLKEATSGALQFWSITREASLERARNAARTNDRTHLWVIRGYRAINNKGATETAFQALIEQVCDALRAEENDQLNNTAIHVGPPSVRVFEPRDFAGYLVHYTEIACPAVEPKTF